VHDLIPKKKEREKQYVFSKFKENPKISKG